MAASKHAQTSDRQVVFSCFSHLLVLHSSNRLTSDQFLWVRTAPSCLILCQFIIRLGSTSHANPVAVPAIL